MAFEVHPCRMCQIAPSFVFRNKLSIASCLLLLVTFLAAPASLLAVAPAPSPNDNTPLPDPFLALSTAISYGGSVSGTLILSFPAPSDVTFQLSSDTPNFVSVAPSTITISQGQTTAPFTLSANGAGTSTISASAPGYSPVHRHVFGLPDVPTFLQPSGTYAVGQPISITSSTPGATIFYTVDGSTPNGSSPVYTGPIPLTGSEIIQAYAYFNYLNGPISAASYSTAALVAFMSISTSNVPFGVTASGGVALQSPAANDTTFALASENPSIISVSPSSVTIPQGSTYVPFSFTANSPGIVTLTAVAPGISPAKRHVSAQPASPVFVQPSGTYSSGQTITITSSSPGALIFYTTDGTTPNGGSNLYTGPITLTSSETIQAFTIAGYLTGPVASATYTVGTSQLNFLNQLTETAQGVALSPSPSVQFQDSSGNPIRVSAPITLSLGANPGNATLGGSTTVNAINGLATFPGITISDPGTGYTLVATSPGYTADTSNAFTVDTSNNPSMTLSVVNPSITTGSLLTGTVTLANPASQFLRVNLSSSSNAINVAPSAIVFAAGQRTAPFSYVAPGRGSAVITASATGYGTASAQITSTDVPNPATYYVSNSGDDGNDGATPNTPWQTLAKVNTLSLAAGSAVYLQCGSTFRENLVIKRSGALNNHILYSSYGSCNGSNNPVISGADLLSNWTGEPQDGFTAFWATEATAPATVFEDNHLLLRASSKGALVRGSYFFDDPSNRVYIRSREDAGPDAHRLEASVRALPVSANRVSYVTLSNFGVDKASNTAIVFSGDTTNVYLTGLVTNYSRSTGIFFTANRNEYDTNVLVQNGVASYNAGNGVLKGNGGTNFIISNYTANNNAFDPTLHFQGGLRIVSDDQARSNRPLFSGIENSTTDFNGINPDTGANVMNLNSSSISGMGAWCDTCGGGSFVTGNEGHGNTQAGAELELTGASGSQSMTYNVEWLNFFGILHASQSQRDLIGNNTTWNNFINCNFGGEYGGGETAIGMRDNVYQNNICASRVGNAYGTVFQATYGAENNTLGEGSGNIYRNNSFGVASEANGTFADFGVKDKKYVRIDNYVELDAAYAANMHGDSTNSIQEDPMFNNPAAGDFTLSPGSPAIGSGYGGVDLGAIPYTQQ